MVPSLLPTWERWHSILSQCSNPQLRFVCAFARDTRPEPKLCSTVGEIVAANAEPSPKSERSALFLRQSTTWQSPSALPSGRGRD